MDKKSIRKDIKALRNSIKPTDYKKYNALINSKIINSSIFNSSKVIYCYSSINNEVDLSDTVNEALKHGKVVAMPKIQENVMEFYVINSLDDLNPGAFNIKEPVSNKIADKAELIIVPGVAFTRDGKRIGYGGGYYDKYLKYSNAYTLGVAFDFQIFSDFEIEEYDIVLDEVITN